MVDQHEHLFAVVRQAGEIPPLQAIPPLEWRITDPWPGEHHGVAIAYVDEPYVHGEVFVHPPIPDEANSFWRWEADATGGAGLELDFGEHGRELTQRDAMGAAELVLASFRRRVAQTVKESSDAA